MDSFPAYFPLAGRKVVIAGSGEPAEAKARLFEDSPATVVRLEGPEAFAADAYRNAVLVFVGDADEAFVQAAVAAARAAGALVNVVDRPALCDFNTPAIIDRGQVVAAVGTGGSAPVMATLLRNAIEAQVPEGVGRVAALLARFQDEVRRALPVLHERRAFLRAAVRGPAAEAALAGDMARAETLLRDALADGEARAGGVKLLSADGPVELLSLRAARALGTADVVVIDAAADPEVVRLARRDVERLSGDEAAPDHLTALAREGRQIVWLHAGPVAPATLEALAGAGVTVDTLPIAEPDGRRP
ncbi:siroheme synthase [Caulobacter segnis]|uniref:precorrin-2 dehydrogenase n=2 Tax=Caulobacter segnis TaxID=88688 RepID=D5VDM7_CAUST|nr:NAD(P)-dependent oxidoreductase [Caulobacter segnis]ADG08577.1 siroheme synthase [Caulobacter segnis ATCC 21756]AVQ00428.1 siroheme synthase [Caulobacter segnis]